jgi:Sec-independent protein translocase protein TatA
MQPCLAFLSDLGGNEIIVLGIIALILFGRNLPTQARTLGRKLAEFKRTISEASQELHREMDAAADTLAEVQKDIAKDDPLPKVASELNASLENAASPDATPAPDQPPDYSTSSSSVPPPAAAPTAPAPPTPALSDAAALDTLARNIRPPKAIPRPIE